MKKILLSTFICFSCLFTFSQNLTLKLIDKHSKTPIPYATIKTGKHSGTITNEEGYFTVNTSNNNLSITISCMGYQNKVLNIQDLKLLKNSIELEEAINQLNEVYISNKAPNADSIIAKAKRNIKTNYNNNLNKHSIFRRVTNYVNFKDLKFEIEKASHVKKKNLEFANNELKTLSKKIKESNMVHFEDFKGELYTFNKDTSKLIVNKATQLLDYENDFTIEQIQEKAQHIILKYLDTTKTYKLKTGIFKIDDSLSLKEENQKDNSNKKEYEVSHLNNESRSFLKRSQFYKNSFLNKILNSNLYEYSHADIVNNNNELTHIINFSPKKGKAKYTGQLFISNNTYAVTRIDYKYYKNRHGEKVNLKLILGIKYIENVSTGTLLFEKDSTNIYHPKYLKHTSGSYFYVNRDVKFIENSSAKNKVNFSFKIEGNNSNKEELLFTGNTKISLKDFEAIKQDKVVPYKQLNKFEKTIWENEQIIEPSLEMKAFKTK
ncbi:carboxypeptidase-like regulatory domain-containing protein [Algibacter sp. PT7-4]|uniref:carboxypeptidase-like regulatory domain-containing protein n=1 Tax=Algibacter ulvanivorans TaxID=3400999 RepID=UPI003AAF27B3